LIVLHAVFERASRLTSKTRERDNANGMYKKPIETIAKEYQYDPLPDEVRAVIIASWRRGGLLPPAAIERMVPAAEATECPTT
jgi:hypothetical protein